MLKYLFTITFLLGVLCIRAQDTPDMEPQEPVWLKNEIGFGPMLMIPSGFYVQHIKKVQPGLSLSYYRNIFLTPRVNYFVGVELNWLDLQTERNDLIATEPDGDEFEYTSIADMEYLSFTFNFRMQPDFAFRLWPYLEAGVGPAYFYSGERLRWEGSDGDNEEEYDLLKGDWTAIIRFGLGVQYFIPSAEAMLDLSWRYNFHGLAEYHIIAGGPPMDQQPPAELLELRRSRATSHIIRLSFNKIF